MSATIEKKSFFPGFISLLLVIALGLSLAKLMWLIITPQQKFALKLQNNQVATSNKKEITNYGKLIADQHIFGEVVVKKAPVQPKKEPVKVVKPVKPKVKLNAKLHGIVAYKSQEGFALISNNNGRQKVYAKGEPLQDGVTISDILPSKVLVDNHGTIEELLLPKKPVTSSAQSSQSTRGVLRENLNLVQPPAILPNINLATENSKPDLNQVRQEIMSNPQKIIDIVRFSPAMINGEFTGFRIRSGKNRRLFRELNFRSNDIITEINGIVLDSANKGVQVLGELENASSLSIKVKRGNQEVFIDHSF